MSYDKVITAGQYAVARLKWSDVFAKSAYITVMTPTSSDVGCAIPAASVVIPVTEIQLQDFILELVELHKHMQLARLEPKGCAWRQSLGPISIVHDIVPPGPN